MADPAGAPPFHPDWKRRLERALARQVLCADCMAVKINVPKRYLDDYLAWMQKNVMITSRRPCEACGARLGTYGLLP